MNITPELKAELKALLQMIADTPDTKDPKWDDIMREFNRVGDLLRAEFFEKGMP